MYGVCTRFPLKLKGQLSLRHLQEGVYEVQRGTDRIQVIVLSELPLAEHNAPWHLFSSVAENFRYGVSHWNRSKDMSTVIYQLFRNYKQEGVEMAYTMEDFRKDFIRENMNDLTPQERLAGPDPKERLAGLDPKERLAGLDPKERLEGLDPKERLAGLPTETIRAYLEELEGGDPRYQGFRLC